MDEGTLATLKAQHGMVFRYTIDGQTLLFRRAKRADYRRFKTEAMDEKRRPFATENLAAACLLQPDSDTYEALLERYPAVPERVASDLLDDMMQLEKFEKKTS